MWARIFPCLASARVVRKPESLNTTRKMVGGREIRTNLQRYNFTEKHDHVSAVIYICNLCVLRDGVSDVSVTPFCWVYLYNNQV